MSRKLNIERRRKRIRHYNARRRQRSLLRRAFSYWWSTLAILIFVISALANTMIWFYPRAKAPVASFVLPKAQESVYYISRDEINAFLANENFQQVAHPISDKDVGILLELTLPTIPAYVEQPLPPLPQPQSEKTKLSDMRLLPKAYTPKPTMAETSTITVKEILDPSLKAANYTFTLPTPPTDDVANATFFIQSNEKGEIETVLCLAPEEKESEFLATVRRALQQGTTQGAAHGTIHLKWRKEALK